MNVKLIETGIVKINGRTHYLPRIVQLAKVGAAQWRGETSGGVKFGIEGGKKAGGSSRDWFLDMGDNPKAINCVSFVDAITCINGA